ncbi:glycosyltransferase [Candidatus Saccharibacteria bacterium]|nr:glycosyltransferase [Candidatus Saccharibacteria bacterium]
MKLLMVMKKLRYSGAYKMFMWVAKALADRGFEVTVFTYMQNLVTELPPNIKWIQVDLENKGFISHLFAVRKVVRNVKPDCVVSFLLDANILNMLACLGTKSRSVVCERNDPFKPKYYAMKIAKPLFRLADGAVYQLPKVAQFYSNIKAPTAVIPNPVLCDSKIQIKPFAEREKAIVTLGRIDIFQKRHDILVRAFAKFSKMHPDYKLMIYGDGPDEKKINDLIANLNIVDNAILGGVAKNPQEVIKNASFFVMTSDFEGIPNALIEAMSIGLPCISTDCRPGGAALLIDNMKNGILVPPHNVDDLAKQMSYLVEHPTEADAMGTDAKKIVNKFAEDKIAQMWCDYLKTFQAEN